MTQSNAARVQFQLSRVALASAMFTAACTGQIDDGATTGGPGSPGGGGPGDPTRPVDINVGGGSGGSGGTNGTKMTGPVVSACKAGGAVTPGPLALRRLTSTELTNTIRDLFPGRSLAVADLKSDAFSRFGFDNDVIHLTATSPVVTSVAAMADGLSASLTKDAGALLGCPGVAAGDPELACVQAFIKSFGERAYRRSLAPDDVSELEGLYSKLRTGGDSLAGSMQAVLQVVLQSADFLYRVEVSPATVKEQVVPVGPWEMASRLSYLLWSSMPDAELFAAARENRLSSKADIEAQARRLLDDPKAHQTVARFNDQWLSLHKIDNVTKDAKAFPKFTSSVATLLQTEAQKYMEAAVWSGSGDVTGLLTGTYTFMNKDLAAYYGVSGPGGATWQRIVDLDATRTAGILTQGGLMALLGTQTQTALPQRGQFVREQILCAPSPPPPADLVGMVKVPPVSAADTSRQRWAKLTTPAACNACHSLINPIGFGLENFDGAGKWRAKDGMFDVDASGEFIGTDIDGPFTGATDMAGKLAGSAQVRGCLSLQWFRFAAGREESDADACTLETLKRKFDGAKGNIRELLVGLTQTEAFMYRATDGGGA